MQKVNRYSNNYLFIPVHAQLHRFQELLLYIPCYQCWMLSLALSHSKAYSFWSELLLHVPCYLCWMLSLVLSHSKAYSFCSQLLLYIPCYLCWVLSLVLSHCKAYSFCSTFRRLWNGYEEWGRYYWIEKTLQYWKEMLDFVKCGFFFNFQYDLNPKMELDVAL